MLTPYFLATLLHFSHLSCLHAIAAASEGSGMCNPQRAKTGVTYWHEMGSSQISGLELAVFPLGSVESHGPHLPLGTDLLLVQAIVEQAVSGFDNVAVLPASPFGASFEHGTFDGSIPIPDTNLNGLWDEVLSSVRRSGVSKVLLVNAHGGQTANTEIAARTFRFRHDALAVSFNVQAMLAQAWAKVEKRADKLHTESAYGIHGGLIETSVMLHLFPHLVKASALQNFKPRQSYKDSTIQPHSAVVSFGWRSEDLCKLGALGDAAAANTDIGAAIVKETVRVLRQLITEVLNANIKQLLHLSKK